MTYKHIDAIIYALLLSIFAVAARADAHTDICERVEPNKLKCQRLVKGEKPITVVCTIDGLNVTCVEVK